MIRNLSVLASNKLPHRPVIKADPATSLFWLGLGAVLLQFVLPYVVLDAMGLSASQVKLHPATVLVIICGLIALSKGTISFQHYLKNAPGLMAFVCIIPFITLYSVYFTGYSGSAVYAESYWSAGLLALMLKGASARRKRLLGSILIVLCVLNVFVALYESVTFSNWFPLVIDPDLKLTEVDVDFRANAFYNHPLTASLITSMAVFLLYAMRLRFIVAAPTLGILLVGLLAFGGRTALGVTLIVTTLVAVYKLLTGIIRRNLKLDFILAVLAAAVIVPMLITVIVTQTSIADRIIDTLYYDDSAAARATQWEIFRYLSLKDWLFGISHDDLNVLKYQIGLGGKETDIENFWFLMLLNLGVIGFSVFCAVFGALLFHLGRYSRSTNGWLLVIASLIIDSGSNSLGVKTSDLFIEVAFLVAMAGYADHVRVPRSKRLVSPTVQPSLQSHLALGYHPAYRQRGLQALSPRMT